MAHHTLKTISPYFDYVWDGLKPYELRFNDRDFKNGDTLELLEYKPHEGLYTGRCIDCQVLFVLHGGIFGLAPNYCILSIEIISRHYQ